MPLITSFPADCKIYCDESCHLQQDTSNVMVFGALRCDSDNVPIVLQAIKQLRIKHGYKWEIKWTKLVTSKLDFYIDLIDLFAETGGLRFKAVIVDDKSRLNHERFNQGSHNQFYYKMAYFALKDFLIDGMKYRIYLDYMDSLGSTKAQKLVEVLENHKYGRVKIAAHIIRSHESQLIQVCDLFIGAIAYANRTDIRKESQIKNAVIGAIESKFHKKLTIGTSAAEVKFNLFQFTPQA